MPNVYELSTVSLFNDLKGTNIKSEDFKKILSSYQKLENSYIKENKVDLFKDLNKQKEIIFSYLPCLKKQSLKKIACLHKKLESEIGNVDEIDTLQTPEKQVQFIKVAYNDGKWTISTNNFDNARFTKKQTPEAINCLVNLANRLDEQEAAYALCHAKKAGLFVMAALPYVRTEDFTNTALEQRFSKDPGTVLGPIEHSWESSTDNTNMPVSRQIASETDDIQEMDTFVDKDGDNITISAISGDAVITFDNDIYTKEEVEENIASGYWTKIESAKDEPSEKDLEKEFEEVGKGYDEKLILNEAANRLKKAFSEMIDSMIKSDLENAKAAAEEIEPDLHDIAQELDDISFKDSEDNKKFQKLRRIIGNKELYFERGLDEYQTKAISKVSEVKALLEETKQYVSPRNLRAYQRNIVDKFFYMSKKAEVFNVNLAPGNMENEEKIYEKYQELKKKIKPSMFNKFYKDSAYKKIDDMLLNNRIGFDIYSKLSDCIEINAKEVIASLKDLEFNSKKIVRTAAFFDSIKSFFISLKNWCSTTLNYLKLQNKKASDIDDKLNELIQEGE